MGNANLLPVTLMRKLSNRDHSANAASETNFMMLSPDCLLKLFEYLHLRDLNEISEVNSTLKSLATYYLRLKHRDFNCKSLMKGAPIPIVQFKRFLNNFGDQIISLDMTRKRFTKTKDMSSDLLLLAEQYCSGYVTTLILDDFKLNRKIMPTLEPLFRCIETMELIDCKFRVFSWETAENLKCLILNGTTFKWKNLYKAKLEQLEEVRLNHFFGDDSSLNRFISYVPALKRLSVVDCDLTTNIFGAIGQLEHLEEFEFNLNRRHVSDVNFENNLLHLKNLKQLKIFTLNCEERSVHLLLDEFVVNGIAIEHLALAHGVMDDATIQSISKLASIKRLRLNGMIGLFENQIIQMINDLQLLESLWVKTEAKISGFGIKEIVQSSRKLSIINIDSPEFTLNANIYKEMVAIVRKRVKQTSLSFTIYSNGGQSLVSDDILQAPENAKWVLVKELDPKNNLIFPRPDLFINYDESSDDSDDLSDSEEEKENGEHEHEG